MTPEGHPVASERAPESTASAVLRQWYEAWNAHDVDAISALMTEDVRYEDPSAHAPVLDGRDSVLDHVRAAFRGIPDLHLEMIEEWASPGGEVIASYFRVTGTFTGSLDPPGLPPLAPTNGKIESLGMDRSEIRAGRLSRHQIFWDMVEVGRQMGAMPPRDSGMDRLTRRLQHLTARRMRRQG
jgi:steroid delta-isomerase-like uncharacterized protein